MQSEAYRLTGFTAVISALGFLIRWLQGMRIIDPETGLATSGTGISILLAALIAVTAGVLAALVLRLRRFEAPRKAEEALDGHTFLYTAACAVPAILLALAGAALLIHTPENPAQGEVAALRTCGVGALLGAAGVILVTGGAADPQKAVRHRVGAALIILFGGLWLVTTYKTAATDPVIWRYAVEILGICAALLGFYYTAGYHFGEPSPWLTIFFCHFGAFLCVMSAVDEHTLGESLCYAAAAILLLIWGFVLTVNLKPVAVPLAPDGPEEAA